MRVLTYREQNSDVVQDPLYIHYVMAYCLDLGRQDIGYQYKTLEK